VRRRNIFPAIVLLFAATGLGSEQKSNPASKVQSLVDILQAYHYSGELQFDERVTNQIRMNFIHSLDPLGLYLLAGDIDQLGALRIDIPHSADGSIAFFLKTASDLYRRRLLESLVIAGEILKGNLDYSTSDEIQFVDPEIVEYAKDRSALVKRWNKFIRYRILAQLFLRATAVSTSDYQTLLKSTEADLRQSVERRQKTIVEGIVNHPDGFETFVASTLMNSIVTRYDPHSRYFSAAEKMRFEAALSTRAYSFGLILTKGLTGETRIERLVPGGPAWKSTRLNKNDLVIDLHFPEENDRIVTMADITPMEADELLNRSGSNRVGITVKKSSGVVERVDLFKEKLVVEENIINSFVLSGEKKIGYIVLPAFYAEWETPGAAGCANDIAKEILKLQKENVDGLILDLRNNGGGSLAEAVDLAGIFIDEGPLFIQTSRTHKPLLIKDPSRGTVYDGPLVVLINGQSASASEFFAAAMKDYNRAVLVGSTTFGKASAQVIVPISPSSDGFLKITTALYYNLSGRTHQLRGIEPDVRIPDLSGALETERGLPYALTGSKIDKEIQYSKLSPIPNDFLADRSDDRTSKDSNFKNIKSLRKQVEKLSSNEAEFSLKTSDFMKQMGQILQVYESYQTNTRRRSSAFTVKNHAFDAELMKMDSYKNSLNDQLLKSVAEDIYIDESYKIAIDYINKTKK